MDPADVGTCQALPHALLCAPLRNDAHPYAERETQDDAEQVQHPSMATKSHHYLCFPNSKQETPGLTPYRNNSRISSYSYECPALRSILIHHS